ncbi:MAG: 3-oxoacyl-[acyl-carrier-protein] reductase [Candidatus Cloacimonetes bacterium]|jgi:3-oxoacyl-[acyl-carrier protein] reductase|nr:3-oxoacyl-[acyl-carrier-protein] reductase [Candidatus Cloacimonadota bacterium]MDD4100160.1 3-oxoacyl-[acyl-carrier-protein] reductase [Candidatus Cloacimonadota bacterium]MDD4806458.1 3-oxoacyl-[acyl-carrier-protein] reductase [Candidatus Cloacimonadota bacterium]
MMYELKDKVVLITGSARGIGFTIAERFAREQALVLILDLAQEAVDSAVSKLREQGAQAFGYVANVTDAKGVEELFARIVSEHGRIDVLINNAGVTRDNLMIRMKEEEWDLVLNINLKGAFICTQKVFKHMMKARSGSIINISSVIGIMGNSGQANYAASKGGMIAFTKSCAKEFASRGIRVNAVAPGFIETEMTATLSDEIRAEYAKVIPLSKMGTPTDVAKLCLFLASEESGYITGQTIAVDGGLTMH